MDKFLIWSAYVIIGAIIITTADAVLGMQHTANDRMALIISKLVYIAYGMGMGFVFQYIGML